MCSIAWIISNNVADSIEDGLNEVGKYIVDECLPVKLDNPRLEVDNGSVDTRVALYIDERE